MDWFPVSISGLSNFSLPLFIEPHIQEGGAKETFQEEFPELPMEETMDTPFMNDMDKENTVSKSHETPKKQTKKKKTRKQHPETNPKQKRTLKQPNQSNKKQTRKAIRKLRVRKTRRA